MRVIAGTAKGITLLTPKSGGVRPATDRVKESVFSIIGDFIEGARVLDLFAGSGAVGIEALSRGAARCTFVENDARCVKVIKKNLARTRLADRAHVIQANAQRSAEIMDPREIPFDLAFVDPPYSHSRRMDDLSPVARLLAAIGEGDFLCPHALVILEHETHSRAPDRAGCLHLADQRRYGGTTVSIYEKSADTGTSPLPAPIDGEYDQPEA